MSGYLDDMHWLPALQDTAALTYQLTPDQLGDLLRVTQSQRDRVAMALAANCGVHDKVIRRIEWSGVRYDVPVVWASGFTQPRTGKRISSVSMQPSRWTLELLWVLDHHDSDADPPFTWLPSMSALLDRACRRLGRKSRYTADQLRRYHLDCARARPSGLPRVDALPLPQRRP